MSDYNITTGWYKYRNKCNDNGRLVNVYKITKQFVAVKIYKYHDNKYDLTNMNETDLLFHSLKTKVNVFTTKIEYPYITMKGNSCIQYKLTPKHKEDYVKPVVVNDEEEEALALKMLEEAEEPIIEKIFATEVKEVINDSIMKDPAICKMLAKNHILEILFNELFKNPCPYKTQDKYYIELCSAIHKL